MITSIDQLRKLAVKYILRRGPAAYLLRHSLGKLWMDSQQEDEMAWTDFKNLYFNFNKLGAQLTKASTDASQELVEPGDWSTAYLAAAAHEMLHNLWLHKYRAKDRKHSAWRDACEYAINFELVKLFGKKWIDHLGVMYPPDNLLVALEDAALDPTTDNFYEMLIQNPSMGSGSNGSVPCHFCDRPDEKDEPTPSEMVKVLNQLPGGSSERSDILRFISDHQSPLQKMPWEALLMGGIEDAMSQEQSWTTPSRRNELMPGWRHEKLLSFVWILDVSPSIDDEMKKSFMATLQAGINFYHDAQHRIIFFADTVELDMVVSSGTNLTKMEIPCGGGTDLTDVWKILEKDKPDYALVLTDLELYAVPKPSHTSVVWGIVGAHRMFDPDYGVKVVLK